MKKIAIFVEGMTEQEFVVWLVKKIAGGKGLVIDLSKQHGGKVTITMTAVNPAINFYVLVVDCSSDAQVKSQIVIQYPTLIVQGFSSIIGLRDIYPLPIADLPKVRQHLQAGLPAGPVIPIIHLAIMEIEAWFISELTHFAVLDNKLTVPQIVASGFPVTTARSDSWEHPAQVLHDIYKIAKLGYMKGGAKTRSKVQRTIAALSYTQLCQGSVATSPCLTSFIELLDAELV
ncbi:hypothetical protein [Rugamonas sp. DEMB1]|uniref:hypothetical protein n=1 Tax=Rugamonas sp. DEMB1 TaxID=3039386 RepID=UPI00244AAB4D|nr:hypothetical protein [Rugamonas sp. DEMB1]WGG50316.1 hypothetical protein QC826_28510 [Rugamonas sp. DEMB1]